MFAQAQAQRGDQVSQSDLESNLLYFSRTKGLFRICFDDNKVPKGGQYSLVSTTTRSSVSFRWSPRRAAAPLHIIKKAPPLRAGGGQRARFPFRSLTPYKTLESGEIFGRPEFADPLLLRPFHSVIVRWQIWPTNRGVLLFFYGSRHDWETCGDAISGGRRMWWGRRNVWEKLLRRGTSVPLRRARAARDASRRLEPLATSREPVRDKPCAPTIAESSRSPNRRLKFKGDREFCASTNSRPMSVKEREGA